VAGPAVVLGVPVYGSGDHLEEALASLVAQTSDELALVFCDDGPGGERAELASAAAGDERISYRLNGRRLGLAGNWRETFRLAGELHPGAQFFGWASDHDVLDAHWVELLHRALEQHPRAVLAYGRTRAFDVDGRFLREVGGFETNGVTDRRERLVRTIHRVPAGDMVYGLFRREALARAGVIRDVMLPDRLLLTELTAHGEFVFVPSALRYRRVTAPMSMRRQRASIFPDAVPVHARLPWWITHTAVVRRSFGARLAAVHAVHSARHELSRRVARARERVVQRVLKILSRASGRLSRGA